MALDPTLSPIEHRLSAAERARTAVHVCGTATLCTRSARHDGVSFGSHVDFILDEEGQPVVLLAKNATHTLNLQEDMRCSLFCQPEKASGQGGCRATLVGQMKQLDDTQVVEVKENYIARHAHAEEALKFPEFTWYKMNLTEVFFIGGYGVGGEWVSAKRFEEAEADPLAFDAGDIMNMINGSKHEDLGRLCKVFLGVEAETVTMNALDRWGFDLRVRDHTGGFKEYRVGFREDVANRFDVQSALVKAFQEAWERENGYDETWSGEHVRPTLLYYSSPQKPTQSANAP